MSNLRIKLEKNSDTIVISEKAVSVAKHFENVGDVIEGFERLLKGGFKNRWLGAKKMLKNAKRVRLGHDEHMAAWEELPESEKTFVMNDFNEKFDLMNDFLERKVEQYLFACIKVVKWLSYGADIIPTLYGIHKFKTGRIG